MLWSVIIVKTQFRKVIKLLLTFFFQINFGTFNFVFTKFHFYTAPTQFWKPTYCTIQIPILTLLVICSRFITRKYFFQKFWRVRFGIYRKSYKIMFGTPCSEICSRLKQNDLTQVGFFSSKNGSSSNHFFCS